MIYNSDKDKNYLRDFAEKFSQEVLRKTILFYIKKREISGKYL